MTVISKASEIGGSLPSNTAVTVGVFDGVHAGHLKVVDRLAEIKREKSALASVLVTFDRHPLSVTHPEMTPAILTTLDEKLSLLEKLDIDMILIEEFSKRIAGIDYRNFISNWLVERLGMRHMVIGYDFHMGRSREGSQDRLLEEGRRTGFGVTVVAPVVMGGRVVSSTNIRRLIKERKLEQAARFLTRPYFFDADVVRGEGLGRKIDFPTANVEVRSEGKLLPPGGIYGVWVEVDGRLYGGMMNIGSAPTIHNEGDVRIEVHVFDFSGDLYGKRIRIHCLKFIRDEKRFECVDALQAQLVRDRREVMLILEKKH